MYDSNNQFNFWESKFVLASFVLVAIFLFFYLTKTFYIKYQINREISTIDKKIAESQAQEDEFQRMAENLTNKDFLEKEARLKLNLKKPGEEVIMIINSANGKKDELPQGETESIRDDNQNNLKKWIDVIF